MSYSKHISYRGRSLDQSPDHLVAEVADISTGRYLAKDQRNYRAPGGVRR
jgi:hypothetical protein